MIVIEGLRVLLFGMVGIFFVMGIIALIIALLTLSEKKRGTDKPEQ